jgi:hypothetical protein
VRTKAAAIGMSAFAKQPTRGKISALATNCADLADSKAIPRAMPQTPAQRPQATGPVCRFTRRAF